MSRRIASALPETLRPESRIMPVGSHARYCMRLDILGALRHCAKMYAVICMTTSSLRTPQLDNSFQMGTPKRDALWARPTCQRILRRQAVIEGEGGVVDLLVFGVGEIPSKQGHQARLECISPAYQPVKSLSQVRSCSIVIRSPSATACFAVA